MPPRMRRCLCCVAERQRNPRIKIVNMSRRFGVAEGVIAGMATSRGDAVVYMDADLQDPPEVIPALDRSLAAGRRCRPHRADAAARREPAEDGGHAPGVPPDSVRLVDRASRGCRRLQAAVAPAVDHLLRLRESDPYLRGLVVWLGFNQVCIPYERDSRHAGRTHFPFFSRNPWKTFTTGLTSFSFMPIYVCFALAAAGLARGADARPRGIDVHGCPHVLLGHDHWSDRRRRHLSHPRLQRCERPPAVHN